MPVSKISSARRSSADWRNVSVILQAGSQSKACASEQDTRSTQNAESDVCSSKLDMCRPWCARGPICRVQWRAYPAVSAVQPLRGWHATPVYAVCHSVIRDHSSRLPADDVRCPTIIHATADQLTCCGDGRVARIVTRIFIHQPGVHRPRYCRSSRVSILWRRVASS